MGRVRPKKRAHVFKGADSDRPPPRAPETHLPRPSERSHRSTSKMSVSGEQFPSPCGQGLPMRCLPSHSCASRSDSTGSLGHSIPWCLRNPRTEGRHGWAVSLGAVGSHLWEAGCHRRGRKACGAGCEKCPEQPTSLEVDFKGHL